MSGLEQILNRIKDDSKKEADAIYEAASKEIDDIKASSDQKISVECKKISDKADAQVKVIEERSRASADLLYRQILLRGKQDLIKDVISSARRKLENMSESEYISFITALLKNHIPSRDCTLSFNERDLKTIPESVIDEFKEDALKNGASVSLSQDPANIPDGFLLDFGGIEENCTFDALIEQNIDSLQDEVSAQLFG